MANHFIYADVVYTYRTIIYQAYVHHCLKDAVFDAVFAI